VTLHHSASSIADPWVRAATVCSADVLVENEKLVEAGEAPDPADPEEAGRRF
jgi:hypothetical protein